VAPDIWGANLCFFTATPEAIKEIGAGCRAIVQTWFFWPPLALFLTVKAVISDGGHSPDRGVLTHRKSADKTAGDQCPVDISPPDIPVVTPQRGMSWMCFFVFAGPLAINPILPADTRKIPQTKTQEI
jgi:hypothetical protein